MRRTAVRLLVVAAVACVGVPAAAQDQVVNGHFHDGAQVSGWVNENPAIVSIAHHDDDHAGGAGSGSASITNTSTTGGNGIGMKQCLGAVTAGNPYDWGGHLFYPSGQADAGDLQIGLRWFDGSGCSGTDLGQPRLTVTNSQQDAWVARSQQDLAPVGAASVEFVAFPSKVPEGGSL